MFRSSGTIASEDTIEIMKWNTSNFEGLVLACIDSYDSESRLIFLSIFRVLQDFFAFAPLTPPNSSKKPSNFLAGMKWNEMKFHSDFGRWIWSFFCEMLIEFYQNFTDILRKWWNVSSSRDNRAGSLYERLGNSMYEYLAAEQSMEWPNLVVRDWSSWQAARRYVGDA